MNSTIKTRQSGITLIELLVAVGLLALLTLLLVMLFHQGLDIWNRGETRRIRYEHAHFQFSKLRREIRQIWVPLDQRSSPAGNQNYAPPTLVLATLPDGSTLFEFVKTQDGFNTRSIQPPLERISYRIDPKRGVFKQKLSARTPSGPLSSLMKTGGGNQGNGRQEGYYNVDPHLLYMQVSFWAPWTDHWTPFPREGDSSGPAWIWDSQRIHLSDFRMYAGKDSNPGNRLIPPAVPKMIRIRLELSNPDQTAFPSLNQPLPDQSNPGTIRVEDAQEMPETGYVRIEEEWCRYVDRKEDSLRIVKRGVRGTEPSPHALGTDVVYGTPFELVIQVPAYPGKNYYRR